MSRTLAAALVAVLALAAGCGSDDGDTGGSTQTLSPAPSASSSSSGCADAAVAAVVDAVSSYDEVLGVTADGGCHNISIDTSLAPGDALSESATTAVDICTSAAAVAYVDGVGSLSVQGNDGHELAAALQGTGCIPG